MPDSGWVSTYAPLCVGETHRTIGATLIVEAYNRIRSLQLPARMLPTLFLNTASALSLSQFRGVAKPHRRRSDYILNTL